MSTTLVLKIEAHLFDSIFCGVERFKSHKSLAVEKNGYAVDCVVKLFKARRATLRRLFLYSRNSLTP